MNQVTPMLKQYLGIKEQYPDAILFFRMGDFYEMFFDDAKVASRILGITLTSRGTFDGQKVPMCGVPHHASKSYISRLVANGYKVAICEQVEDPKTTKGIVKRDVIRVVTPGSLVEERDESDRDNLYMAAVSRGRECYGLAYVDLTTGEFRVTELKEWGEVLDELGRINPAELLLMEKDRLNVNKGLGRYRLEILDSDVYQKIEGERLLREQLGTSSLAQYGCEEMTTGIEAAGAIVHYLKQTQKDNPQHIREIIPYRVGDFMFLDDSTVTNLELLQTMRRRSEKGSLFHILNKTLTPMGSRLMKKWIAYPLIDLKAIRNRLASVADLKENSILRAEIREALDNVYDLERLNGKIAMGRANPRDLVALKNSIRQLPALKKMLLSSSSTLLSEIGEKMDLLADIEFWIDEAIEEDPPISLKEGGVIKEGFDPELDKLIELTRGGKEWITKFAAQEQDKTGIPNLKVGYNRVFGYYIEISKGNVHLAPPHYIRKQTLVNGERFITEELKQMEEKILGAEEKRIALEQELFDSIRGRIARENTRIKDTANHVAQVDVLAALAEVAELYGYTCPEVNDGTEIDIRDGRHPVVELTVKEEDFVPNDIHLDGETQQMLIITGPNMAGKSTILRQTALTVLMAQMGGFVPAGRATIGIVDRIFTRVGASDDLALGRSTFMVEMNETANILRHATPRSLVVLDEIGRGTSTYDGLSIAWAVAEALHDREGKGVRTLFATHYHELTELASTKERVKNFNIAVKQWRDKIIFLRKLVPGGTSRSYGIEVARIAGIPEDVIKRAREILENLENDELRGSGRFRLAYSGNRKENVQSIQLTLFESRDSHLIEWIKGIEISKMTPLEALVELNRIKEYVKSREKS